MGAFDLKCALMFGWLDYADELYVSYRALSK